MTASGAPGVGHRPHRFRHIVPRGSGAIAAAALARQRRRRYRVSMYSSPGPEQKNPAMETILAVVNRVETAPSVLRVAECLAGRLRAAQVSVLHPRPDHDPSFLPTEEYMTADRAAAFRVATATRAGALHAAYEAWRRGLPEALAVRWIEVAADPAGTIVAEARAADLVIVGHASPDDGHGAHEALRAALYDASAPVIVAPVAPPHSVGVSPAVAWEDTPAVAKAAAAALPLLRVAGRVTVLVGREAPGREQAPPADLLRTLEHAGVACDVVRFDVDGMSIGVALMTQAEAAGADLLVMGGYTHSHLREVLLGGATQTLLAAARIPLLMHH